MSGEAGQAKNHCQNGNQVLICGTFGLHGAYDFTIPTHLRLSYAITGYFPNLDDSSG